MKIILFAIVTFFMGLSSGFASALCEQTWSKQDEEAGIADSLERVCTLETKNFAIEAVLFKKECIQWEGGEKQDCFFVRECNGEAQNSSSSITVYNRPEQISALCKEKYGDFEFLGPKTGSDPKTRAYLECEGSVRKQLVLKYGDQVLKCEFPFK